MIYDDVTEIAMINIDTDEVLGILKKDINKHNIMFLVHRGSGEIEKIEIDNKIYLDRGSD